MYRSVLKQDYDNVKNTVTIRNTFSGTLVVTRAVPVSPLTSLASIYL